MEYGALLILNRKDLILNSKEKDMFDIKISDIKDSLEPFKKSEMVVFVDDNGNARILKSRYVIKHEPFSGLEPGYYKIKT